VATLRVTGRVHDLEPIPQMLVCTADVCNPVELAGRALIYDTHAFDTHIDGGEVPSVPFDVLPRPQCGKRNMLQDVSVWTKNCIAISERTHRA
jgi:hypothetical protein